MMIDHDRLQTAYEMARSDLLAERDPDGHWTGELSSSALSVATAVSALSLASRGGRLHPAQGTAAVISDRRFDQLIRGGVHWLVEHQNSDGGWGDTDRSFSNVSTTFLAIAALQLSGCAAAHTAALARAEQSVQRQGDIDEVRRRYGVDKTFAVPILTNLALAGRIGWDQVAPLPFELACIPQAWYRFAGLPVVSYAIPALVAVGQAGFVHRPPSNRLLRWIRNAAIPGSLRVLEQMQPASGGYLEAVPLTSFVVMCLSAIGRTEHPVAMRGLRFLSDSVRPDGSWPIDTNLATWNTTLAINALTDHVDVRCIDWLLSCQHRQRHPYTGAAPGGWGWTDLSGGVPDVDDTSSALLALRCKRITGQDTFSSESVQSGLRWLLKLQNSDGGWPTFCRGWGKLPFDRSGTDLTAHAVRALNAWYDGTARPRRVTHAMGRGFHFLKANQQADGSWFPLWFGNQRHADEANPVYGTAKVLLAYQELGRLETDEAGRGIRWLIDHQNADGGWGGGGSNRFQQRSGDGGNGESSVEETALAVETLLATTDKSELQPAATKGLEWLVSAVERNRHVECSPIGFYFAKLWYYERLYPRIFTVSALGRALGDSGEITVLDNSDETHVMNPPREGYELA